jgi:MFS superfamily sulfate permease-like transporter
MAAAILLAAVIEELFGIAKLGKLVRYVSEPVLAGFMNAFALFIVKSQLKVFGKLSTAGVWQFHANTGIAAAICGKTDEVMVLPLVFREVMNGFRINTY